MKVLNSKLIRKIIQASFFLWVFGVVIFKYLEEKGIALPFSTADLHAICPFGAIESLGRLILSGKFITKIHESNYWLLSSILIVTLLFGSYFCGWLCPLGSIQDFFSKIGSKIIKNRVTINKKIDKALSYVRYILLIIIVYQTTKHLTLGFAKYDPFYALYHFWTGEALPTAIIVLVAVLISSLFVSRPWCRWFCPLGGFLGLIQIISPWKIKRESISCINCNKCTKACPMGIDVATSSIIYDTRCNRCEECVTACPVESTLDLTANIPKKITFKNGLIKIIVILLIFITPILISKSLGLFKTTNKVEIVKGKLTTDEIKGSMTLKDLADGFNISKDELFEYLALPGEITLEYKIRDIEDFDESITLPVIRDKMILWD